MAEFETLDQINAHYAALIEKAEDDQKLQLQLERAEARAALLEAENRKQQRASWKAEALSEFKNADPQAVNGDNREEMLASAKASHEHVEKVLESIRAQVEEETRKKVGQQAYGSPSLGGGGAPTLGGNPDQELIGIVQRKLAAGGRELTEQETNRFAEIVGSALGWKAVQGAPPKDLKLGG